MKLSGGLSRIVVVEDDPELARTTGRILGDLDNVVVELCPDVASARRAFERSFDVLVSDFQLPDGTGEDVLAAAAEADENAPRIVVTGYTQWDCASRSLDRGAFRLLAKPVDARELQSTITDALAMRRAREREADAREDLMRDARALAAANADLVVSRLGADRMFAHERERFLRAMARAIDVRFAPEYPAAEAMARIGATFAARLGLASSAIEEVELTILLHRIGSISRRDGESSDAVAACGAEIVRSAGLPAEVSRAIAACATASYAEAPLATRILVIVSRYVSLIRSGASHHAACAALIADEQIDPELVASFVIEPERTWSTGGCKTMPYAPAFEAI